MKPERKKTILVVDDIPENISIRKKYSRTSIE